MCSASQTNKLCLSPSKRSEQLCRSVIRNLGEQGAPELPYPALQTSSWLPGLGYSWGCFPPMDTRVVPVQQQARFGDGMEGAGSKERAQASVLEGF